MNMIYLALDRDFQTMFIHPLLETAWDFSCDEGLPLPRNEKTEWLYSAREVESSAVTCYIGLGYPDRGIFETLTLERSDTAGGAMYWVSGLYSEAAARETARIKERTRLTHEAVRMLKAISDLIFLESSTQSAAGKSLEMLAVLFQARAAALSVRQGDEFRLNASYGLPEPYADRLPSIRMEPTAEFTQRLMEGNTIILDRSDYPFGPGFEALQPIAGIHSGIIAPIREDENLIGVLFLGFDEIREATLDCLDILENAANEFHFLIEKNRFYLNVLKSSEQMKKINHDIILALSNSVETRDTYTSGHSVRVSHYAVEISRAMGWDEEMADRIGGAALLHDIGKVGIPDAVLLKPNKLSHYEYEIMKLHPELSANIVSTIESFQELASWVRYHHENYDGSGYPYGLSRDSIPLAARIIAVADAFDAMTSDRPYRKALSFEEAQEIFRNDNGSQWDPEVVRFALQSIRGLYREAPVGYAAPEKLGQFRQRIFHMSLTSGLYLYEYILQEAEKAAEQAQLFSMGWISLRSAVSHLKAPEKRKALEILIELARENMHYPVHASRYDVAEILVFAPGMSRVKMEEWLSFLKTRFFERTDLLIRVKAGEYSKEGDSFHRWLENFLREE